MKKIIIVLIFVSQVVYTTTTSTSTRNVNVSDVSGVTVAGGNGDNDGDWEPNELLTGNLTTWYLSWDNTNLYIGRVGGNNTEPSIIYIQAEYSGSSYTSTGFNYDNFTPDFSSITGINFVAYLKSSYDEYRTWGGSWSGVDISLTPSFTTQGSTAHMELSIPWNSISSGNGKPSYFRIVFYMTNGNSGSIYAYGESPTGNPDGSTSSPIITNWWGGYSVTDGVDPSATSDAALPVELTSFIAVTNNDSVNLNWETATEVNNYGFEILRSSNINDWTKIGFVNGNGNSNSPKHYLFVDHPTGAVNFQYKLKQIDFDGAFEYSPVINVELETPPNFSIQQNYPNPFNPSTTIEYQLPQKSYVTIKVFDSIGNELNTLVSGYKDVGNHQIKFNAEDYSSGVYFYTIKTDNFIKTNKMLLIK